MRTEWGYAANPNVGATLMVGLGCEVFQIGRMKEEYEIVEGDRFKVLTIQADRRHAQDDRGGSRADSRYAAEARSGKARAAARQRADAGSAMRRIGRLFWDHGESGFGRSGR